LFTSLSIRSLRRPPGLIFWFALPNAAAPEKPDLALAVPNPIPGSKLFTMPCVAPSIFGGFRVAALGAANVVEVHPGFPTFTASTVWASTPPIPVGTSGIKKLFAILDSGNRLVIFALLRDSTVNPAKWSMKAIRENESWCTNDWKAPPAAWMPVF
jgi:hypothetical protein